MKSYQCGRLNQRSLSECQGSIEKQSRLADAAAFIKEELMPCMSGMVIFLL